MKVDLEMVPLKLGRGGLKKVYRDPDEVSHVILHTTGPGPARVAKERGIGLVDAAVHIYQHIMDDCAHCVIGKDSCAQTALVHHKVSHTGGTAVYRGVRLKASVIYRRAAQGMNCPDWWKALRVTDPDLFECQQDALRKGSFNEVSIGIEMVEQCPDQALAFVAALKEGYPSLRWLTHHAAMNPLSRTDKRGQYDLKVEYQDPIFGKGKACKRL